MKPLQTITLLVLMTTSLCCTKRSEGPGHLKIDEALPEFTLYTITGQNMSTADFLGKPSVIVFFSTTCPDCHKQLPEIQYSYNFNEKLVNFMAIAREEDGIKVQGFWNQAGYTLPVSAPGTKTLYNLFDRGSGTGVPQLYIADKNGIIRAFASDKTLLYAKDINVILQELQE